jgi:hypothetical protein
MSVETRSRKENVRFMKEPAPFMSDDATSMRKDDRSTPDEASEAWNGVHFTRNAWAFMKIDASRSSRALASAKADSMFSP